MTIYSDTEGRPEGMPREPGTGPSPAMAYELFSELCDLPAAEQAAELEARCGGDPRLRAEVEALLAEDAVAEQPLDAVMRAGEPFVPAALPSALASDVAGSWLERPESIGGYEVVAELGRGGMGVVYEARQPTPRRSVALKLIRPGLVTRELLERFRREADVLGSLNHPGIAQVYEAGTAQTPAGELPFIAMELVRGEPLDRYVRNAGLGVGETLELLARLCDALHHAHQRGVVHRDLKPGNVLVNADGTPKVLDFGVARVVRSDSTHAQTANTRTGQLVGTLAYMSPEQVRSDSAAIDARTDVYALGVMAFELLSGARPLAVDSQSLPEAARSITEDEPLPLGRIDRRLRGDVEVMVAMAIAKEPGRRYASAADLAADLRRHLAGEPIAARPPSRTYQLRKFARRNKAVVGGITTAFLAMAIGTGIATWKTGEATRSRIVADSERRVSRIEAYRGTLAATQANLEAGNVASAVRSLDMVPAAERRWEWAHLASGFDRAAAVVEEPRSVASALDRERRLVLISPPADPSPNGPEGQHRLHWYDPGLARVVASQALPVADARLVSLSVDGRRAAAIHGPRGRRVEVWAIDPGWAPVSVERGELRGEGTGLALSTDGAMAVATTDAEALVLGAGDQAPRRWEHGARPLAVTINAAGTHIGLVVPDPGSGAGGGSARASAGSYRVFDLVEGLDSFNLGRDILAVALSPDGRLAATSEADGVVRIREAMTGSVQKRLRVSVDAAPVGSAAFDRSGLHLAATGGDGATSVWGLESATPGGLDPAIEAHRVREAELVLPGRSEGTRSLRFGPDSSSVVSLSQDGVTRLHDTGVDSGAKQLTGHSAEVVDVLVSPDSSRMISGAMDGTLRFWDGASDACYASIRHGASQLGAMALSAGGAVLATGHAKDVFLWDPGRPVDPLRLSGAGTQGVLALSFDPKTRSERDGRLAVLDATGTARIWDLARAQVVAELAVAPEPPANGALSISPSGRYLIAAAGERVVLASGADGTVLYEHRAEASERANDLEWVGSEQFVSGWSDGTIRLHDKARSGAELVRTRGAGILSLALLPGEDRLVACTEQGVVEIWDVGTRRLTLELRVSGRGGPGLASFPDGSRLVAAHDSRLSVFDTVPARTRATAAARLLHRGLDQRDAVAAYFERSADPLVVTEALFREPALSELDRRAALTWTLRPPVPDPGVGLDPFDGHALRFGGGDEHVSLGDSDELRMGPAFTVEAWIRPRLNPSRGVDSSGRASGSSREIQIVLNKEGEYHIAVWPSGELQWMVAGPDGWMPGWVPVRYEPPPGRWTHIALVRSGVDFSFFVNGRKVQDWTGPALVGDHHPGMNELRIGGRQHTPSGFVGDIDEVRIWSVARSPEELRAWMHTSVAGRVDEAVGLTGAWTFDEGSGAGGADAGGRFAAELAGPSWLPTTKN